ncbi:MAG: hypothetical protein LBG71_01385 [Clostridiales Family XIII bacterium]|jgi:hypothetical protein|nr:hypothetical protein [Clostridiales Family XIII bacterium]
MNNRRIGRIGAGITGVAVAAFAISMLVELICGISMVFVSQLVYIFIALGYVVFTAAVVTYNRSYEKKAAGFAGMAFSAVYATLILIVYYAGVTTVAIDKSLSPETLSIISYAQTGSLFFNYDLLGYGIMALSTFFVGFTVEPRSKGDRAFRLLLWIHGVFFPACLLIPMLGVFNMSGDPLFGTVILEVWCLCFLPLCALGYRYFRVCGPRKDGGQTK